MQRFKNILVFAGTQDPKTAIRRAFEIASENQAVVTLMDVIKPLPAAIGLITDAASPEEIEALLIKDRQQKLKSLADEVSRDGLQVKVFVGRGDASQQVVKRVLAGNHDLVIKTADGGISGGDLFGSVARSLLRNCPCPMWILKPQIHGEFDQVLAAVDIDAEDDEHKSLNRHILELAHSVAKRDNAKLHIVSVWDLWMEQALRRRAGDAEIDQALSQREAKVRENMDSLLGLSEEDRSNIEVHLRKGTASTGILEVAEQVQADLIVMGTVCRTGVAGFLIGNTAENLLADVTCSVLAIKPSGFETPISIDDTDRSTESLLLPMV